MELKEAIENLKALAEPQCDLLCLSDKESIKIVLEAIENYQNTIEVIEDLGRRKITVLEELDRLNLENRKLKRTIEDITGIENADEEVWDE